MENFNPDDREEVQETQPKRWNINSWIVNSCNFTNKANLHSPKVDIVSEAHFSFDTVDRGLRLAINKPAAVPWNGLETDRNIRIGKWGYVLILFYWF